MRGMEMTQRFAIVRVLAEKLNPPSVQLFYALLAVGNGSTHLLISFLQAVTSVGSGLEQSFQNRPSQIWQARYP